MLEPRTGAFRSNQPPSPQPIILPDGQLLTTIREAHRCGWEWRYITRDTWHNDDDGPRPDWWIIARPPTDRLGTGCSLSRTTTEQNNHHDCCGDELHRSVLYDKRLTSSTRVVALALRDIAGGRCSHQNVAELVGLNVSTVRVAVRALEKFGYLTATRTGRGGPFPQFDYRLHPPQERETS